MQEITYILPWVLASVTMGVVVGVFLGRWHGTVAEPKSDRRERETTLKVLGEVLRATEQMMSNVECHNSEFRQTSRDVANLPAIGEMEVVKQALLGKVEGLLSSNKRLESDLKCSRYEMEEQAQQLDHVRLEARTDALTTVANRKAFDEKLHVLRTFWERQRQPFALLLIDLDHFKWINDAHGHQAGDGILTMLGNWLKEWVREGDMVARYGGDEFAVLLPHAGLDVAASRAETIRSRAAEKASRIALRGEQVALSLSIGVAAPLEGDTEASVLARADEALYRAKRAGRNQVSVQLTATEPAEKPPVPSQAPDEAAQSAEAEPAEPVLADTCA